MSRVPLLSSLLLLAACSSTCSEGDVLAELSARNGEVERDYARSEGQWQQAEPGARFAMGDGLRTGAQSSAELALRPSGSAHVAPRSVLRFLATPPRDTHHPVALEEGEIEILAEQIDLEVHTPLAIAQLSPGSRIKLSMHDGRERFDLSVGRVVVAYADVKQQLEPARPLELGAEPRRAPDAGEPVPIAQPTAGDAGSLDTGQLEASDAGALDGGELDLVANARPGALRLSALESATVHAASVPVEVFVPSTGCAEHAELRVDGQQLKLASAGATALLAAGSHRLRLTCPASAPREARLLVKRDPARLELPKRAQSVRIEADGRRYTVRYQNLLPDLTLVWRSESEGGAFTLLVQSEQRTLTRALVRPDYVLPGSVLGEGEHKFWFRDDASGRSSKPTTLRLAFDNTARSAYLSAPVEGSAVDSQTLSVEGAALQASRVSVEGTIAKLDGQGRFRTQLTLPPGQKAVSVRVEHPGSGVHYYLRRLQ